MSSSRSARVLSSFFTPDPSHVARHRVRHAHDFFRSSAPAVVRFHTANRTGTHARRPTTSSPCSCGRARAHVRASPLTGRVFALPLMNLVSPTLTLSRWDLPLVSVATNFFSTRIHDRFERSRRFAPHAVRRESSGCAQTGVRTRGSEAAAFEHFNRNFVARNRRSFTSSVFYRPCAASRPACVAVLWYAAARGAGDLALHFVEFNSTLYSSGHDRDRVVINL